jgi:predicted transcriptional regulator of viral defense system
MAAEQHGLVALWQLEALGINRATAHWRVEAGRLHRVHEGVYAVGYLPSTRERELMAAVLACGPEAVLSHRSAAELWGLRKSDGGPIDVTTPGRRGRSPQGIASHRNDMLAPADRSSVRGIPCTTVARTLLDFAAVAPVWELRKALSEAEVLRILNHAGVRALIRRNRGRRGVARLRMVMDEIRPETKRTRSEMERGFLRLCERAGLPRPEVNVSLDVGGRWLKPDFLWREAGLILEADSRTYHDTDSAFQVDRKREQCFQLAGWEVSHCTWEQIFHEPAVLAKTISTLIARSEQPRRRADTSRSP